MESKYIILCKKVFSDMKYSIQGAQETDNKGYEVVVSYETSDVFTNFITAIGEESKRLTEKVENGEYRGTLEEINSQMQADFMNNAYTLFEECYNKMEYGEEETYIFTITKDSEGMYGMDEKQISEFITKILDLDVIQG